MPSRSSVFYRDDTEPFPCPTKGPFRDSVPFCAACDFRLCDLSFRQYVFEECHRLVYS
jgi:hypothetical protein